MFGKNIKKIRSVHGLNQQQFAEMFDLKRATLGAYEEGRSNPKMDTVIKIANHFSIDIEDLLTKELTVNRLLKFNEAITTSPASPRSHSVDGIPCVTEELKQQFLKLITTSADVDLPKVVLPNIPNENKTAFVIDDLAMSGSSPAFLPKDIIIGESLPLEAIGGAAGKLVVVATDTQLLFRRMSYFQDKITLTANHSGILPVDINQEDVRALWQVVHVFHYTLPTANELEQRLAVLESTIASLGKK